MSITDFTKAAAEMSKAYTRIGEQLRVAAREFVRLDDERRKAIRKALADMDRE